MLTAKDGDLDEAEGLDTGADDYLRKPFSFPVLVARVHALLRRAALGEPPPLAVGDLTLDLRGRRVHRGGTEVALTAREFDLLVYLVRRAGSVVSKQRILAGVWDDEFEGDPNVVEVYVARLRRKLDEPFGRAEHRDRPRCRLPGPPVVTRVRQPSDRPGHPARPGHRGRRARGARCADRWRAIGLVLGQRAALLDAVDEHLDQQAEAVASRTRGGAAGPRRRPAVRGPGGRGLAADGTPARGVRGSGGAAAPGRGRRRRGHRGTARRRDGPAARAGRRGDHRAGRGQPRRPGRQHGGAGRDTASSPCR